MITNRPDRDLTVENVHADYHVKYPLSVITALVLTTPWIVGALTNGLMIYHLVLIPIMFAAHLLISVIVMLHWVGGFIYNLYQRVA